MLIKQCSRCKQNKPIEQFGEYKNNKDGLRCWCEPCIHEYNVVYHQEHREHTNEQSRNRYHNNPEENIRKNRAWRLSNEDYYRTYQQIYYQKNKEQRNENSNSHYKNNPKRYRDNVNKYRKTERGNQVKKQSDCKRRKYKKWIPILPNIFPTDISIAWHHIEGKWFVAPIPLILHKGGPNLEKHMEEVNDWIEFYYNMNPIEFIKDGI